MDSWDEVPDLSIPVLYEENKKNLHGLFCCLDLYDLNTIYINENSFENRIIDDSNSRRMLFDSALAHELIHFLVKSSNIDRYLDSKAWRNLAMNDAFAYWFQNKYIERYFGYSLLDFIGKEDFKYEETLFFRNEAGFLYGFSQQNFIFNAVQFFDEDLYEKHDRLVNNGFYDPFQDAQ